MEEKINKDEDYDGILNDLDTSWLDEFEKIDNEYKNYYNENQIYLRVHFVYVNNNSEIEKIKEQKFFFSKPNSITKEELIALVKRNSVSYNKMYSLVSILKFNINIKPQELKSFMKPNYVSDDFLQSIKNIDNISFDKSISIFHDINDLFIILYEKQLLSRKIADNLLGQHRNCITKKVYINPNAKKYTRRKQFKAVTTF